SRTDSLITTRGGVVPCNSSAIASRSTDRSIAPMRLSRQFVVTALSDLSISSPRAISMRTRNPANCCSSCETTRSSHTCCATRSSAVPSRMSHAYSACSARERARDSTLIGWLDLIQDVGRLERRYSGIPALVSVYPSSASERLIHGVARQQPEADRDAGVDAHQREAARRLTRNEIEVRRIAPNDRAECDERIVASALARAPRGERQFPRAGHPDHIDVVERHLVRDQRLQGTVYERTCDRFVEA